jgi:hypothetical protein
VLTSNIPFFVCVCLCRVNLRSSSPCQHVCDLNGLTGLQQAHTTGSDKHGRQDCCQSVLCLGSCSIRLCVRSACRIVIAAEEQNEN